MSMQLLIKRRWNAFDALYIGIALAAAEHSYVLAAVIYAAGVVLSVWLEIKYGKD